jgi:hypothetical protein
VVESLKRNEILPPSLCSVLPGQHFSLPASSDYFDHGTEKTFQSLLRDVASSYISQTDDHFTKLLKCLLSPTVGAKFGLKVLGSGEHDAFKGHRPNESHRVIEGKLLERDTVVSKKDPKFDGQLLVLVFASSTLAF